MLVVDFTSDGCECARGYHSGTNNIYIVQVLVVDFTGDGCECTRDYHSGTDNIYIVQVLVVDFTGDGCECTRDYHSGTDNIYIVQVLVVDFTGDGCECTRDYHSGTDNIYIVQVLVIDFTGDGCECARDYCSETNNTCQNGGACSRTSTGGFSCSCQPGVSLLHIHVTSLVLIMSAQGTWRECLYVDLESSLLSGSHEQCSLLWSMLFIFSVKSLF